MKIAITGHRPNKLGNDYDLTSDLIKKIKFKIQSILTYYNDIGRDNWTPLTLITGMALGIDTLFALLAIENKRRFIAAIPCLNHGDKWPNRSKEIYDKILSHEYCDKYIVTDEDYNNSCMQKRNVWMVDNCDILIAVWDGTPGGTSNCVKYAKSVGTPIIWIHILDDKKSIELSILMNDKEYSFDLNLITKKTKNELW